MRIMTKLAAAAVALLSVSAVITPAAEAVTTTSANSATPSIRWRPCQQPYFAGLDCGTLRVPVDWARPWSRQIELSLVRRQAADPTQRVGSLLLNNSSGRSSIEQLRYALVSGGIKDTVLDQRFDLVAVDPRGIGHSTPTTCAGRPQRAPGVTYFPASQAQYRDLVRNNRALAAACGDQTLLTKLDRASIARDLEAVRIGLGERQLNWYGIGWSAVLGKTYEQLFPGRLRTLLADSAEEDTTDPVSRLTSEILAAEDSFNRFAAWCRDDARCALTGQDVGTVFDQLVAKADRTPIPTTIPGKALTGEDIRAAMQDKLNLGLFWPKASQAIKKAIDGDATELATVNDKTLDFVQAQTHACVDTPRAASGYAGLTQLARMAKQLSPHLGGAVLGWRTLAGCQGWPVPVNAPTPEPVHHFPPTLIAQSTHQSSTPYTWGLTLSATLPGSVVLSREGDDYSMYQLSPCVRDAADRLLVHRKLPAPGSLCTT